MTIAKQNTSYQSMSIPGYVIHIAKNKKQKKKNSKNKICTCSRTLKRPTWKHSIQLNAFYQHLFIVFFFFVRFCFALCCVHLMFTFFFEFMCYSQWLSGFDDIIHNTLVTRFYHRNFSCSFYSTLRHFGTMNINSFAYR